MGREGRDGELCSYNFFLKKYPVKEIDRLSEVFNSHIHH